MHLSRAGLKTRRQRRGIECWTRANTWTEGKEGHLELGGIFFQKKDSERKKVFIKRFCNGVAYFAATLVHFFFFFLLFSFSFIFREKIFYYAALTYVCLVLSYNRNKFWLSYFVDNFDTTPIQK